MEYNEDTPYVDDSHEGDAITLVSNVGGRKDKKFSRNYAWAKHAADRGKLKEITVKVVANGESYRTIDAFRRAVGRPHPATRVFVDGDVKHALAIVDEVTRLVPAPEPVKAPRGRRIETVIEPVVEQLELEPETQEEVTE